MRDTSGYVESWNRRRVPITKDFIISRCRFDYGNDCWEWQMACNPCGYAHIKRHSKTLTVSRLVWKLWHGEIPDGMLICHRCDNRSCCNPAHLFLGTKADNTKDCMEKLRFWFRSGIHSPQSKLNLSQVLEIRSSTRSGKSIAQDFKVTPRVVYLVRRGHSYKQ